MTMLSETNQTPLDGRGPVGIDDESVNGAPGSFHGSAKMPAATVGPDDAAALHQTPEPGQASGYIRSPATRSFNAIDGQHRNRRIGAQSGCIAVHQLVEHEVSDDQHLEGTESSQ
jgi:hypothetical protein|tara:strand:+ start:1445 stop:1789 length:345 start_codon:yes stop_codon:yes gene_type:complete